MADGKVEKKFSSEKRLMIASKSFVLSVFILLATLAGTWFVSARGIPIVVTFNIEKIPMEIGRFRGSSDVFPQGVYDELRADRIYRHYQSAEEKVDLYRLLRDGQRRRTGLTTACLPAPDEDHRRKSRRRA
jgi:hypothetical protein